MGKLQAIEELIPPSGAPGTGLVSLDKGGKEWHLSAFKTDENTWDDAMSAALALAEAAEGIVALPPHVTIDLHPFTIPAGVELVGNHSLIRRAATYNTSTRHWITLQDGASIDGVVTFDGNSGVVAHSGAQSCFYVVGDDCYIGYWVSVVGFETGTCYAIDVYGDRCEVNGYVEGASYASLRVAASIKPLTRFTSRRFESVNASAKGFVYNGTEGIDHLQLGTMILTTNSENIIADGFLTDSETGNTPRIQRLTIDHLEIYGWQSNGAKIENVGKLEIGTFRARTPGIPYGSGAGLMCRAYEADINVFDSDDRAVFEGSSRVGLLRTRSVNQHGVHVIGAYGSQVEIGTLDMTGAATTNPAIRIDTSGAVINVKVGRYLPSLTAPVALHAVAGTAPANDVGYLTLDRNLGYLDLATSAANRQKVECPPKQFTARSVPSTGTWLRGWLVWNDATSAGGWVGWSCVQSGTFGTLNGGATTGSISSASDSLTVSTATGLVVGQYITIAGVSGVKRITDIAGTTVTLDSAANATVSGAAVAFSAPVFKGFGEIEA